MSFQDRPYYIPLPMNSSFFWGGRALKGWSEIPVVQSTWILHQCFALLASLGEHCFWTHNDTKKNIKLLHRLILYLVFSCCLLSMEAFFHSCSLTQSICKLVFWKVNTRWWPPFDQIHSNGFHAGISTIEVVIQLWITASMRTWTTINLSNQNH